MPYSYPLYAWIDGDATTEKRAGARHNMTIKINYGSAYDSREAFIIKIHYTGDRDEPPTLEIIDKTKEVLA